MLSKPGLTTCPTARSPITRALVLAKDGEKVVYSWIEWPSKEARDEGWKKVMDDERMKRAHDPVPFDGQRMIYGGFAPILDE